MKKIIPVLLLSFLLVSCNFSLFNSSFKDMTNHSPSLPEVPSSPISPQVSVIGLRCSDGLFTDKITISWKQLNGADLYKIERATLTTTTPNENTLNALRDSDYEVVSQTSNLTIDDTSITDKSTYYAYRVTGISLSHNTSSKPSYPVIGSILSYPSEIECSKGTSETNILITYSQVPGAEYYYLYKNDNESFTDNLVEIDKNIHFNDRVQNTFIYTPSESEKGKILYFSIKTISSNGTKTQFSETRTGYTKVVGAPLKPTLSTNKGKNPSSITLTFSSFDEGTTYTITKSKNGGKESIIYNSADLQYTPLVPDSNNNLNFTDSNVEPNTEYIYAVYGSNDLGAGEASSENAYLLSPVKEVSLIGVVEANKLGYKLEVIPPLGASENLNDWSYVIKTTEYDQASGTQTVNTYDVFPIDTLDYVIPFFSVQPDGSGKEIREVSIAVKSKTSIEETTSVSDKVLGIPKLDENFSFSGTQNVYDDSIGAATSCTGGCYDENGKNRHTYKGGELCYCIGVFPVVLRWNSVQGAHHYRIKRSDGKEWTTDQLRYNDSAVSIGRKYNYIIYAEDVLNRHNNNEYRTANDCYGALSGEQYIYEFQRHVEKPWEFQDEHPLYHQDKSKGRIWSYIRKSGTGSLTSGESASDDYISSPRTDGSYGGTVTYKAAISGLAGTVTFSATEGFGESDYIYYTHDAERKNPNGDLITINKTQGYTFTANMDGNADDYRTISNNNVFYLDGWYGKNMVQILSMKVVSQHLVGTLRSIITYNTLDGQTITKVSNPVEPIKYRYTEGGVVRW
ncbi:MAG: hypothetical protein SPJ08_03610 [Sphaerochaetaceae bacterium]|nr:hypothetical protein [Sphaerochaetaceae bacterium]